MDITYLSCCQIAPATFKLSSRQGDEEKGDEGTDYEVSLNKGPQKDNFTL